MIRLLLYFYRFLLSSPSSPIQYDYHHIYCHQQNCSSISSSQCFLKSFPMLLLQRHRCADVKKTNKNRHSPLFTKHCKLKICFFSHEVQNCFLLELLYSFVGCRSWNSSLFAIFNQGFVNHSRIISCMLSSRGCLPSNWDDDGDDHHPWRPIHTPLRIDCQEPLQQCLNQLL